jgi:hypothetical protein
MNEIKIRPEYGSSPIWMKNTEGWYENSLLNEFRDIIPNELMISIVLWDEKFQKTFDIDYPPNSGFESVDALISFNEEGEKFVNELTLYFNGRFECLYFPLELDYIRG